MNSDEKLSQIINKLELVDILDDIVRGDPDRDYPGLQRLVKELKKDVEELKRLREQELNEQRGKNKLLSNIGMANIVQFITTIGIIATLITLVWGGGVGTP